MNIPNYIETDVVKDNKLFSDTWKYIIQQVLQQLQRGAGTDGFAISVVSSANNSVTPPFPGGQLQILQNSFNPAPGVSPGVQPGTVVFDPNELNGGAPGSPLGQLKVLLNDGTFHKIVNL